VGFVIVVVVTEVDEGLLKFCAADVDLGPMEFVLELVEEAVNPAVLLRLAGLDETRFVAILHLWCLKLQKVADNDVAGFTMGQP